MPIRPAVALAGALALLLAFLPACAVGDDVCPETASTLPPGAEGLVFAPNSFLLHPHCVALNAAANPTLAYLASGSTPYADAEHGELQLSSFGWDECGLTCLDRRSLNVSGAGRVVSLTLNGNPIETVTPGAFADMTVLRELRLWFTRLNLEDHRWLAALPSLTDLDIFHNQVLAIHAYTFRHQGELEVMQLGDNAITVIEPGGFSGLGSLTVLYLQVNRLPRIPTAALQDVPLLAELVMFDNPLTGIYAGDFAGPWTNNLYFVDLQSPTTLTIEDAAFADISSGPLASTPAEYDARGLSINTGKALYAFNLGGIGGRDAALAAIIIQPSPVVCAWRGGAVANLSCDTCTFGYVRNAAGGPCELPAFGISPAAWTPLARAKLDSLGELQRGMLRLGSRLALPAPSLSADKKAGFVGYAGFDYGAISYELAFNQDVDLGCGTIYTNDSSADPPVVLSDTSWDRARNAFGRIDRPQYLRIKVTTAGSFRFSACDSLYPVSLGLYNRSTTRAEWPYHPAASNFVSSDHVVAGETAYFGALGLNVITGSPRHWGAGCESSDSANRTAELDPGDYVLSVRDMDYADGTGGIYYVKMECFDGAETRSPRDSGDPGGIGVDAETGAISGVPARAGTNITMRLLARDALGKRAEVARWAFDVVDPKFDTISGWDKTTLDTDRRVTDKYHFDELHSIDGPADPRGIFETPANNDTDAIVYLFRVTRLESGDTDTADYDEWGNLNSNCSPVRALTDIFTGAGAFRTRCTGQHHATLTARDGGGAEVTVNEWNFNARPRDTDVNRYGPNGIPCQRGSAIDGTPMDGNFNCDCTGSFSNGPNCEYSYSDTCNDDGTATYEGACTCDSGFAGLSCQHSDVATCNGNGKALDDGSCDCDKGDSPNCAVVLRAPSSSNDTTSTVIGGVLGGVLVVVLAALVGLQVQVYVLKHRPVDVGEMQRNIIYSLGLALAKNIGPREFGIALTLTEAVDVVADRFRSDLVAALRKAVPKLSANLTTATVTNVAASTRSTPAASSGSIPVSTSQQVLVVISREQLQRGVAESTVDTLVELAAKGKLRIGANAVNNVRIAIPRVVPREISRQALTNITLLGEGEHGAVFQYQLHEKNKGRLPFPVAAKTLKATAETPTRSTTGREALLKEAALMALFDHRNVVALVGVCTVPRDVPALVLMVLCDRGTLQEHLENAASIDIRRASRSSTFRSTSAVSRTSTSSGHRLSVSERLTLCAEVLQGLDYLSNLRIVHRDIAARNVLLDSTGTCKISDFGMSLSLHLNDEEKEYALYITVNEALAIRWAAIEVLNDHKFSKASDVWAVGVLFWEVFADGRLPHSDKFSDLMEIQLHVKAGGKLGSPSSDCPVEVFNELMLPCWEADPRSRPSARALYEIVVKHGAVEDAVALEERKAMIEARRAVQKKLSTAATDVDRTLLGVSVDHLSSTCVPAMLDAIDAIRKNIGHELQDAYDLLPDPSQASIWHMVHAYAKPVSEHTVCPRDGELGCAYVDTLSGKDDVGRADALLSYSWGYLTTEVSAALSAWAERTDRDPKRTYIWICSLCLNQFRMADANIKKDLQKDFGDRVLGIGQILPMLDPWDKPGYVKRAWCLFELYTAIQHRDDVNIDIVLSPKQAQSFRDRINRDGNDARAIEGALKDIKSENAQATDHADLVAIQTLIQKTAGGHATINAEVGGYLRRWFVSQGGINPARRSTIQSRRVSSAVSRGSSSVSLGSVGKGERRISLSPGDLAPRRKSSVSPLRQLLELQDPSQIGPAPLLMVSTDV